MTYPSAFAQPPHGAAVAPPAAPPHADLVVPRRPGTHLPAWLGLVVLAVLALGLVAYFVTFLGPAASVIGAVLAIIPFAAVLAAIRLIDRWEPEPRSLMLFALAWGAVGSVVLTLGVDLLLVLTIGPVPDAASAVVQAPVVEELAKGLGVFLLFAFARRSFDGPVDGVVYGALVGAGFAFTENILYFADSLIAGGIGGTVTTFVLRGILSPFAHVMFTAVTGYMLGLAARGGRRVGDSVGFAAIGIAGAIVLHALWNGSAVFSDFFSLYALLQVPLFALFIVGIVLLRREEARLTRIRLGEYAAAGWFSAPEVEMLATSRGRSEAIAWARRMPGDRSALMREFIHEATALAAARQRVVSGRAPKAAAEERVYLARTMAVRQRLLAP